MKTSKIEFKLDPILLKSYKLICEKNGLDMSKRLRKFIEFEVVADRLNINLIKELEKLNS